MDTRTGIKGPTTPERDAPIQDEKLARLSPQEHRILLLVAEGLTNKQIGSELMMGEKTVKKYVSSILLKLEVERRAAAAAYLVRNTFVPVVDER